MTAIRPAPSPATVRVFCQAPHPDPDKTGQVPCGRELGDVPEGYVFIGTASSMPAADYRRIRKQCARACCKTWNIFEQRQDGGA